jgi:ABC-2 type transport system permease protein
MNRALLKKSLHEAKVLFAACAAWLFGFCWIRVWIVSSMEESRFANILDLLGDNLVKTLSPVSIQHLVSFTGRIALAYDDGLVVFVMLAFAISRGSDVVAGELGRGTLEMVLAQPVSRLQVLLSQAVVTVAALALLATATFLGTWAGIQTTQAKIERQPALLKIPFGPEIPNPFAKTEIEKVPMRTQVKLQSFAPAALNLFCLGLCFAGGTSFLSACDRFRWRTIGITLALFVLQAIAKIVGVLKKDTVFEGLKYVSALTAFEPSRLVEIAVQQPEYAWSFTMTTSSGDFGWGPLAYDLLLVGLGVAGYVAAAVVFSKRDLPAPL